MSSSAAVVTRPPIVVWDLVLTIALFFISLILDAGLTFAAFFLVMQADSCGVASCNTGAFSLGWAVAMVAPSVVLVVTLILAIVSLVKRRRSFWIPLVGIVGLLVVWGIGVAIVFASTTGF